MVGRKTTGVGETISYYHYLLPRLLLDIEETGKNLSGGASIAAAYSYEYGVHGLIYYVL